MPQNVISRYSKIYRHSEINFILNSAKQGESLCLMGVAGVGKSNIVNFLRDIEQNAPQVEQDVARLFFPIVDATQWQGTANSLWMLMSDALNVATASLPPDTSEQKVIPISEDERAFKYLQTRLDYVCQKQNCQVMFVLDDFDRVISEAPLDVLERLNVLRSAGNRGALSYLVLTKKLPHVLGSNKDFGQNSKFYDLFKHSVYALEPYNKDDALRMLAHLNEKADSPLTESQLEQIYRIAGGHAGLLKAVFNLKKTEPAIKLESANFVDEPDVQWECERVFSKLHKQEQQVSLRVAQGKHTAQDEPTIKHLKKRGLFANSDGIQWFSPLMDYFLQNYKG